MSHATSGRAGIRLEETDSGINEFDLGVEETSKDGITFKRVRFTAAKDLGTPYIIGSDFTVGNALTTAGTSVAPVALGVPQVAFAAPDAADTYAYGWIAVKGPLAATGIAGCSADIETYTSSTSGQIGSLVSGAKRIEGFKFTAAVTQSTTPTAGLATQYLGVSNDL